VTGVLQRVTADSLVLTAEKGTSLSLPTSAIERIELSQGMRSRAGQGAAIGGLIGGAVGLGAALVFEAAVVGSAESSGIGSGLVIIPAFTLGGAALGLGVGAVVGALSRREEWVTASRPRVSVGVAPRKAAAWLALGIAF